MSMAVNRTRFWDAFCILALFFFALPGPAPAQDRHASPSSYTASVTSLATPAKARDHFERARRALSKGLEGEYDHELAMALSLFPGYADAYVLRASHELLLNRYEEALDDALAAQRFEPAIHWATVIQAIACNQLKLFDQASALLDGLHTDEKNSWQAIFERTRAAVGTRDTEAALHWSERALATVPEDKIDDTVLLRGDALLMAHRWNDAAAEFQTYLRSPRAQPKREEVLALLERIPELASRDPAPLIALTRQ